MILIYVYVYPFSFFCIIGLSAVDTRNQWQKNAVENTRLGIPTSFIYETLHSGYDGGTNFPMPPLQAQTWDRSLVQDVGTIIAKEASISGIDRYSVLMMHGCSITSGICRSMTTCVINYYWL